MYFSRLLLPSESCDSSCLADVSRLYLSLWMDIIQSSLFIEFAEMPKWIDVDDKQLLNLRSLSM